MRVFAIEGSVTLARGGSRQAWTGSVEPSILKSFVESVKSPSSSQIWTRYRPEIHKVAYKITHHYETLFSMCMLWI